MRTQLRRLGLERLAFLRRIADFSGFVSGRQVVVLLICLNLAIVHQALSQENETALGKLRLKFELAIEKAELPFGVLAQKYRSALASHAEKLQKSGELDDVLLVREEIERFDKERSPAAERSTLESLSKLQQIYVDQHDLALEKSEQRLAVLKTAYKKELEALVRKLTVDGEIEQAIEVRKVLEKVDSVSLSKKASWEQGMVLHLGFESATDGVVSDLSGSENHGTIRGDATLEESTLKRGGYLSVDGDGDDVKCAHDDSLVLTTDCTIALWIRPRELRDLRGLVSKYNPNNSWVLRTSQRDGKVRVIFGTINNNSRAKTALKVGEWVHVAVTLSDHKVSFYLNGAPDGASLRSKQVPLVANRDPVTVGSDIGERFFKGDIDEVRIFRRALSDTEIAKIYHSES